MIKTRTLLSVSILLLVTAFLIPLAVVPPKVEAQYSQAYISSYYGFSGAGCTNPFYVWVWFINPPIDRPGRLWVGLSFRDRLGTIYNVPPQDHSGEWSGMANFQYGFDQIPTDEWDILLQHFDYRGMQYVAALWTGYDGTNMVGWITSTGWQPVAGCNTPF